MEAREHEGAVPLVRLRGVRKSYGEGPARVDVLRGIDLEIFRGEIAVVLGASGSGKSTLLNVVGGLDPADDGSVEVCGERLDGAGERELASFRRRRLGFVFQSYNLIGDLTVAENVEVCRHLSGDPLDAIELMEAVGLSGLERRFPGQLSGGQQQRVAIARAVAKNPELLLCDEPTGALDTTTSHDVLDLISRIRDECGTTVVMVTHNEGIAPMADRVVRVRDGFIVSDLANECPVPASDLVW